jgi:broad specificity phosphatase PhoE
MTLKYEVKTEKTIDTINKTLNQGIKKISVLIRHSDRFFSKEVKPEAFMGLTDIGKDIAFDFGLKLRSNPVPKLCSSFIGRCIETAYLIDKGYTKQNNLLLDHNYLEEMLGPIFVKDVEKTLSLVQAQETNVFLRNWFDKRIDEKIMENPEKTSDNLCEFMIEQIKNLKENQIALCISHDWSIFTVKEFKMNLKHETSGDVGYLDGLIFFEKDNKYYITNYQSDPILL